MNFAFYISNHGYGHAARNIPLIEKIWKDNSNNRIFIKTDSERIAMIKRNLAHCDERIVYCEGYSECGVLFREGCLEVDAERMQREVKKEIVSWDLLIEEEKKLLVKDNIDVIVSDVTPWVFRAAKALKIPSVLISNFTWYDHYQLYLGEEYAAPYKECYELADKALLYELHVEQMSQYCRQNEEVSLVARTGNPHQAEEIRRKYAQPLVFVSVGMSVSLTEEIDVENLPYTFIVTQGVSLKGNNVVTLPDNVTNTMDYISASDYVITKCGWSTVSEILLNGKKCALLAYSDSLEEKALLAKVTARNNGIKISCGDFQCHLDNVLRRLESLDGDYSMYRDDRERIVRAICTDADSVLASKFTG